jgi:hypothetical protein
MKRWFWFLLAFAAGVSAGLFYGWRLNPVKYVDTTPDTLRIDYQSDFVLMTAEAYQGEQDIEMAARRLALLGDRPPADIVRQAILFGENRGYTDADLESMRHLEAGLQFLPGGTGTAP